MLEIRKFGVAAGTFSVALGIGFVMQNGDALAARMGQNDAIHQGDLPMLPHLPVQRTSALPELPNVTPLVDSAMAVMAPTMPTTPQLPQATFAVAGAETVAALVDVDFAAADLAEAEQPMVASDAGCGTTFEARAAAAATVDLTLSATCSANTVITIHHQGMLFTAETDATGALTVTAPALTETAVFIADIGGEEGAVAVINVPDFAMYDRAVLQWQGTTGFELHAREFGAAYNEPGHVWHAVAGTAASSVDGTSGFMMSLGQDTDGGAYFAQVYTYPSGHSGQVGDVALTVEAEVSQVNCGRTLAAQTIQIEPGATPIARDLEMTLPECDAVGDVLVLNNMLRDLTLASR